MYRDVAVLSPIIIIIIIMLERFLEGRQTGKERGKKKKKMNNLITVSERRRRKWGESFIHKDDRSVDLHAGAYSVGWTPESVVLFYFLVVVVVKRLPLSRNGVSKSQVLWSRKEKTNEGI
jgi:hypothetical protein